MARQQDDFTKLSEVIKHFIKDNKLEKGLHNTTLKTDWKTLMGNGVASYTTNIELKNNTLYVQLSSAALREELSYGKTKIIALLNEHLGKDIIKKIVLH